MKGLKEDICVIENMLDKYKKIYYSSKKTYNDADIENEEDDADIENEEDDANIENEDKVFKMYALTLWSIVSGLYIVSHGLDNLGEIEEVMDEQQ